MSETYSLGVLTGIRAAIDVISTLHPSSSLESAQNALQRLKDAHESDHTRLVAQERKNADSAVIHCGWPFHRDANCEECAACDEQYATNLEAYLNELDERKRNKRNTKN